MTSLVALGKKRFSDDIASRLWEEEITCSISKHHLNKANGNNLHHVSNFLLSFFFSILLISAATTDNSSYKPSEIILVACGAPSPLQDDSGRNWTTDVRSKYAPSSPNTYTSTTIPQTSVPQVPYSTARIFHSRYTYTFPVSAGWKFIRLYFYPANYSSLDASNALFTVTADRYTLLRNFSSYNTTKALNLDYLMREFSINTVGGFFNLTFTPSARNAYAFVNGIEIVSMPDIFPPPDKPVRVIIDDGLPPQLFPISNDTALQTVTRLNVGGRDLSPQQDSGLFRAWYDDSPYIYGAALGVTPSWDLNKTFEYTTIVPPYTAPKEVYQTARSMGPDPDVNRRYNLTWIFPIDIGFKYLVRLHFCEIQSIIYKENQRVFFIFLHNKTAEEEADVISWGKENGVPVYKDYVVQIDDAPSGDLWVAFHPNIPTGTEYFDSILNGLEIFKLSDDDSNLGGPNPPIPQETEGNPDRVENPLRNASSENRTPVFVGGAMGAIAIVALSCLAFAVFRRRRRQRKNSRTSDGLSVWPPISPHSKSHTTGSAKTNTTGSYGSSLPSNLCRHFSFAEIKKATNDFDEALRIGVGGFGKVYRGTIDDGEVAIKRANPLAEQGLHEFQTEIEMLSKLRHRHLVSLIGYCDENSEMILVYDFMAQGTLRDHLYKTQKPPLPWRQRLEICIGAARGLHYLHTGAKQTIIHRDVKTTNILLDDKWVAKVSDFGLSKTGPTVDNTHVSTIVKGSFGYLDPEYFRRQQLTEKSDVYSFGVVLFEVLCARPALNTSLPKEQVSLAEWALHCQNKGVVEDIIDPYLKGKITPESLKKFSETAEKCLADSGVDRPAMGDVLWNLEFALQLQESAEEVGEVGLETDNEEAPLSVSGPLRGYWDASRTDHSRNLTDSRSSEGILMSIGGRSLRSEDSDGLTPSAVFSQIMNPNGR